MTKPLKFFFIMAACAVCVHACRSAGEYDHTPLRILILGNSITHHGPLESIGWSGNWGMAASAMEKDFVHVLIDTIKKYKPDSQIDYQALNIAYWEQNFEYDFSNESLLSYNPDILIIRLGENVDEAYGKLNHYEIALGKLIDKFRSGKSKVIVTGNFWPSAYKDSVQEKVALDNQYAFVSLNDLAQNPKNQAGGQFENGGVAAHPSDFGMRNIAARIFTRMVDENWY